jgi:thiamine biosynthesis lipoprotein
MRTDDAISERVVWPVKSFLAIRCLVPLLAALAMLLAFESQVRAQVHSEVKTPLPHSSPSPQNRVYRFHRDHVLGTSLDLQVVASSQGQAARLEAAVVDRIKTLERILSTYDSSSEISRLNKTTESMHCSRELFAVLQAAESWRSQTDGALNCNIEPLISLWAEAAKLNRLPNANTMENIVKKINQRAYILNSVARTAHRQSEARLNFNALAKGYIIDQAIDAARQHQPKLAGMLLDIGGDIYAFGSSSPDELAPWPIGVADPRDHALNAKPVANLLLMNQAVATSGSYHRHFQIAGKRYSHVLDPRSGWPANPIRSATVVAADAMSADALATALSVLDVKSGLTLIQSLKKTECLLIDREGRIHASKGWQTLTQTDGKSPGNNVGKTLGKAGEKAAGSWPDNYKLQIDLTLARPKTRKYRRPYAVIWIEDSKKNPVRTLTLWGKKSKYVDDLSVWYRWGRKHSDVRRAVTRATRSAGKYQIDWDGKDDNGKMLARAAYTVHVEVAREHGKHVHMSAVIDCTKQTDSAKMQGNIEVSGVVLKFGKAK